MKILGGLLLFAAFTLGIGGTSLVEGQIPEWETPGAGLPVIEKSPSGDYSIVISVTSEPYTDRLSVFHKASEIAHYAYQGALVSIYWSKGEHYVALNNHNGHRGWYPWIISLKDGRLIRVDGKAPAADYDRYQDYSYMPEVTQIAKSKLTAVYPGYLADTDRRGEGHITVIYGWKDANTLLMFDEIVLDHLYEDELARLSVCSLLNVGGKGFSAETVAVQKTKFAQDNRPGEVVKVLGY